MSKGTVSNGEFLLNCFYIVLFLIWTVVLFGN